MIKYIILLILLIFIAGCDSRLDDDVVLSFTISNNLNENGTIDVDTFILQVRLIGVQDFITNQRIDIDYDNQVFTLTGETNSDRYLLTKEDGISVGELNVINKLQPNTDYVVIAIYEDQIIEQIIRLPNIEE